MHILESIDDYLLKSPHTGKLKRHLSKKRYEHTLRVVHTAYHLARKHHVDVEKSVLAALLHDCAKNLPEKRQAHILEKHQIEMSTVEKKNPELLHAKVGACLAIEDYHVHDFEVLNAIRYHTTGRPDMTEVEKVVYISDYIEPHRNHGGRLDEVRKKAVQDLDLTMFMILEDTLSYLKTKSKNQDPMTHKTFLHYQAVLEQR